MRHFADGDFEGARRLFQQADHEHHAPTIVYNLARAEERLNHVQAAVDAYERYLAEAGLTAEFAEPAAIAVADLRAHSCRVRIESKPPGARAFVDGNPLPETTPTVILLPVGLHHVVVEGDTWRAATDIQTAAGVGQTVGLDRPEAPMPPPPPPPPPTATPHPPPIGKQPTDKPGPSGLVYGGSFVLAPFLFLGATVPASNTTTNPTTGAVTTNNLANSKTQYGFEAAMSAEVGYAFAPRAEIVIRALGGIGSTCHQPFDSHIIVGGPAINYRVTDIFGSGRAASAARRRRAGANRPWPTTRPGWS